jgi:hypothetical protein
MMKIQMGMKFRIYPNQTEKARLAACQQASSLGMPGLSITQPLLPEKSILN